MHQATVEKLTHTHARMADYSANESRTLMVVLLTTLTMAIEILAGYWTGSMALLADGWHVGTHTLALLIFMKNRAGFHLEQEKWGSLQDTPAPYSSVLRQYG